MEARIVRMGNSKGIRVPKPVTEQTGVADEVSSAAKRNRLVVRVATGKRADWSAAFAAMAATADDAVLDGDVPPPAFDRSEWQWRQ